MFTLEGLVALFSEGGVKSAMSDACLKQFNPESLRKLASEFALNSQQHTVPSNFIEIWHGIGSKAKKVERLSAVSKWDIMQVQEHIMTCRCDPKLPYKDSRSFVKPIENEDGQQYKYLVTITQRIKSLWLELGAGQLARNKADFYMKYLYIAFGLRNHKKFNLSNLVDEGVHQETLSILSRIHKLKTDPNKWLTSAIYAEYLKQFERKEDGHLFTGELDRYPFYLAGTLLQQAREGAEDQGKEIYLKMVPVWVAAQKRAFDTASTTKDVKLELGYLVGNNSIERFNTFRSEMRKALKEQEAKPKQMDVTDLFRQRL
jgi:hypothetical protein